MSKVEATPAAGAIERPEPIFVETHGNRTIVWLSGDHDASTVDALSAAAESAIANDGTDLVLDLRGVDFMDSSTVGAITRIDQRLRRRSRSLAIQAPSRFARMVLDPYGLSDFLEPDPLSGHRAPGHAPALTSWVAVPPTTLLVSPHPVALT